MCIQEGRSISSVRTCIVALEKNQSVPEQWCSRYHRLPWIFEVGNNCGKSCGIKLINGKRWLSSVVLKFCMWGTKFHPSGCNLEACGWAASGQLCTCYCERRAGEWQLECSQGSGAAGPPSAMDENNKFFCLQVCLEYSNFAKGKGGKEEDGSQRGEGAQIGDAEWFEHLKDVNSWS